MNLKPSFRKTAIVASIGLLGVAMSGSASAVVFNANATVQNALVVTNVADMNLGTIFATTAASAAYRYMSLSPLAAMGGSAGSATLTLIGLGGQVAAKGSVAVGVNTPFTVTLPAAEMPTLNPLESTGAVAGAITALKALADQVEVRATDPSVARFQLVDFVVGNITNGTASANCTTLGGADTKCTLTPAFGATAVDFNIGATIVTDVNSSGAGVRDTYQAAPYTGTFTVTATY